MISFNLIPASVLTPGQYLEIDNSQAVQGLTQQPHKILVIAQRSALGVAAPLAAQLVSSAGLGDPLLGRGSMGAEMIKAAKKANPDTEMHFIAVDENAAGAAATGSIKFDGTATAAGTLNFYIAHNRIQVGVAELATPDVVAAQLITAVNANTTLPVTAAIDAGDATKVDFTCKWKGETGNDIDLRLNYQQGEALAAGMTAPVIVAMNGGTANPDLSAVIAALGDEQYNTFINPYTDSANMTLLHAELLRRFGPMVQQEGSAFCCINASHAGAVSYDGKNSPYMTVMGNQNSPTAPWVTASIVGAIDAFETVNDPARPRQTLIMTGHAAPAIADRYNREERNIHLQNGIATFYVDAGGQTRIERLVTSYQTSALGIPDVSYLDVTTVRTVAFLRFDVRAIIALRFPRHKLADDGTRFGAGQAIVTPSAIRAELIARFKLWEQDGLAENITQFKKDLVVQRSTSDANRIEAIIPPDVINQFRVFAGSVQFRL